MDPGPLTPLLCVVGPTATGKSALALDLAVALGGELVCCDSVQVYRGFVIGSAAPSAGERARAPHHLFGALEASAPGDAGAWARQAHAVIAEIRSRGAIPIVVGGTGLYLRALLEGLADVPPVPPAVRAALADRLGREGPDALWAELKRLDPRLAERIQGGPANTQRVLRGLEVVHATGRPLSAFQDRHRAAPSLSRYRALVLVLERPREALAARIERRVDAMLQAGLLEEVRALLAAGVPADARPMCSLGYREASAVLSGTMTLDAARTAMAQGHRRYAKRQATWFRQTPGAVPFDTEAPEPLDRALGLWRAHLDASDAHPGR